MKVSDFSALMEECGLSPYWDGDMRSVCVEGIDAEDYTFTWTPSSVHVESDAELARLRTVVGNMRLLSVAGEPVTILRGVQYATKNGETIVSPMPYYRFEGGTRCGFLPEFLAPAARDSFVDDCAAASSAIIDWIQES